MDKKTRKKFEDAGWKTSDAQDLLDLSDAEAAFIDMKLALAHDLRALRKQRRLNQTQVARIVGPASPGWQRWRRPTRACRSIF